MISNRILQTTVEGLKAISRVDLCIVDADKNVAAKTFDNVSECLADAISFIDSPAESQAVNGFQFFKVEDEGNLEYIIMARGTSDDVYMVGKLAAFQIQNLLVAYKERFDKDNFIKNLLLDNLLRVDMYTRAEKLHIETDVKRVVYIIETKHEKDTNALETVRTLFANKTRDFITAVDEKSIILVKEVKGNESYDELDKTADVIIDMLSTEAMSAAHVAYGTIVNDIREVSRSYKEAKMALDVGKIFYSNKNVVAYSRLESDVLFISFLYHYVRCSLRRYLKERLLMILMMRLCQQLTSSLRIALMFQKHQDSFTFIEIHLFTDLIKYRR